MNFSQFRRRLQPLLAERSHLLRQAEEERRNLDAARKKERDALEAQRLVQAVAEGVQASVHRQLSSVVTRCLKAVFGDEDGYEFRIRFSQKRGRTEAELLFVREDMEIDPATAAGGGAVEVAAFGLRVACLMLAVPRKRRLLVLDEPLSKLSKNYRPAARDMILALAKELKIQTVIVTHSPELMCGKVIEVGEIP